MTVNILTLGCSKNLVDSEHLLAQFRASGYKVLHNDYEKKAEVVIINTCGFLHFLSTPSPTIQVPKVIRILQVKR